MIVGGADYGAIPFVEVIEPVSGLKCKLPELPSARYMHSQVSIYRKHDKWKCNNAFGSF